MNGPVALHPQKWARRFTLLGSSAAVQAVVQVISGISGLLLVRTLDKQQYAWFTIAMTMSSSLTMLSDAGIGTAVTSMGGRVWQDRPRFSGLIRAALGLRRTLTFVALAITVPWTLWLLMRNGAALPQALLLTALMIAPVWAIGTTAIFSVVNKLHSRLKNLQAVELTGAATKFVLIAIPALLAFINVTLALAATAVSFLLQAWLVRHQVAPLLDLTGPYEEEKKFRPEITAVVRHMYANSLFLCIQGQLATWVISLSGTNSRVADLGALSRLAILFAIIGTPIVQVISPAFARCADPRRLRRLFTAGLAGYVFCLATIVLLAVWRGDLILWILGDKYAHLQTELVLMLMGFAIGGVTGFFWALNLARGWVGHIWLNIPLSIGAMMLALCRVDVSTVRGAAWLGIILATANLGHSVFVCVLGFRKSHIETA